MLTITPTTENKHIMIQKGNNVEKINCCRVFDFRDNITRIQTYHFIIISGMYKGSIVLDQLTIRLYLTVVF